MKFWNWDFFAGMVVALLLEWAARYMELRRERRRRRRVAEIERLVVMAGDLPVIDLDAGALRYKMAIQEAAPRELVLALPPWHPAPDPWATAIVRRLLARNAGADSAQLAGESRHLVQRTDFLTAAERTAIYRLLGESEPGAE